MTKRQKFVLVTIALLLGMIGLRVGLSGFLAWRIRVFLFALVSLGGTIWALRDEDFSGVEWLTLPILPTLFATGVILALPLLPERVELFLDPSSDSALILGQLLHLTYLAVFVVGYYACLLTSNIFNVAAVRSIQLLRVAHSVGFLITVATALFYYLVISALHLSNYLNFLSVFGISFILAIFAVWSVNLSERLGREEILFALVTAISLGQVAWVLSFWPVGVSVFAIFLTAIFYELVGIIQYHLGEKLNPRLANEFIVVAIVVFLLTLVTTQWSG